MVNEKLKNAMKETHLKQWQVADLMGINEFSLSRKLRYELPEEEQQRIIDLIHSAKEGEINSDNS